MNIDDVLKKKGLKFDDLEPMEKETLFSWMNSLKKNELTVIGVREYVTKMRDSVAQGLSELEEVPPTWLSVLCFMIPLVGIIRKWYLDQKRLMLTARLRNYILLEAMLTTPERAKAAVERALNNLRPKL